MTKHSINTVLRASTAKVQTVYRGKYPSRLRFISIGKGETHITSNDHRVLHVVGDDHRALVVALKHQLPTLADTIEVLAQHVADYRNAMQAGRTTGRIAHHVMLQIGLFAPSIVADKDMMDNELKMSYAVIAAHGSILGHFATVHESTEAYRKARNDAWQAAKNDRAVTACQIYNQTGIDIYRAKGNDVPVFMVYGDDSTRQLCEGGVYTRLSSAKRDCDLLNADRARNVKKFGWIATTRYSLVELCDFASITVETDVLGSMQEWQLAILDPVAVIRAKSGKAGKVARLVAEEIDCELSGNHPENPPFYESAVVQAFAGSFPSESSYGEALKAASAACTADCAIALPGNAGADGVYSVAVYHVERCYGGPEEGGWYYDRGEPSIEFALHLRMFVRVKAAVAYAAQLDATICAEANKGARPLSSVLSTGRYRASVQDGYPAAFPQSRPHYE